MEVSTFYLCKKTGTYADALAAIGLAHLLSILSRTHPLIADQGWAYAVAWPAGRRIHLDDLDYESLRHDPGYPYVAKKLPDPNAPPEGACILYEKERERLLSYRSRRQALLKARANRLTAEDREELGQMAPMPGWYIYQNLNVLQAFGSYNQLHSAIRRANPDAFRRSAASKLGALARGEDPARTDTPFSPKLSAIQALNPSVGKGINRPKPDGTGASGLPGFFVDWFEEWLRYVGVNLGANGLKVGDNIKVMAVAPGRTDDAAADRLRQDFVSLRLPWLPVQMDIQSALGLAEKLVARSGLLGGDDADPYSVFGRTPRDVVAGIQTAFFTNLGNAYALTNTSFIGLPGWFPVTDAGSAEAWVSILNEHRRILRILDEERSEEAAILLRYRDFLSAGTQDLAALLEFWAMYACHVIRRGGKNSVPLFTIQNTGRLLMSTAKQYSHIVESQGFRAVAAAMRRATVSEQFHKAKTGKQEYEIHYGLFQDLRQKARFKDQVVVRLSEFVASYNYENARRAEQQARSGKGEYRRRLQVTQQQLDELVTLLDDQPEVVTMLLIAYGSARNAREAGTEDRAVEEPEHELAYPDRDGDETVVVED